MNTRNVPSVVKSLTWRLYSSSGNWFLRVLTRLTYSVQKLFICDVAYWIDSVGKKFKYNTFDFRFIFRAGVDRYYLLLHAAKYYSNFRRLPCSLDTDGNTSLGYQPTYMTCNALN